MQFLDALDFAYGRHEWWNRLKFYGPFLDRVANVQSPGLRDGLVHAGSRVFRIGVRAIQADLRAREETAALERMARRPPRLPRSAP